MYSYVKRATTTVSNSKCKFKVKIISFFLKEA